MPKGSRWTEEENTSLSKAWMSMFEDPVVGDEQTSASFWARIYELWVRNRSDSKRTATALKNQWNSKIQPDTQKFVGYFKRSVEAHESGTTLEDIIKSAVELFQQMENCLFEFIECWKLLKNFQSLSHLGNWTRQNLLDQ